MQLLLSLVGDLRDVIRFLILSMLGKSLRSNCQVAGKVSKIACREQLNRVGIWICRMDLKPLKDPGMVFPVRLEHVVKQGCQLMNLTWNRQVPCMFQQSPRCRLPCQIPAVPALCFQHSQTICDDLAEMRSTPHLPHALQECCSTDASNWQVEWPGPNC